MRCHPFVLERRALLLRGGDVLGQQKLYSVRTEASSPRAREQDATNTAPRLPQPEFKSGGTLLSQWSASLFSPFANAAHVGARSQHSISSEQAGHLGEPQSGLNRNQQEGAIPATSPGAEIGRR